MYWIDLAVKQEQYHPTMATGHTIFHFRKVGSKVMEVEQQIAIFIQSLKLINVLGRSLILTASTAQSKIYLVSSCPSTLES